LSQAEKSSLTTRLVLLVLQACSWSGDEWAQSLVWRTSTGWLSGISWPRETNGGNQLVCPSFEMGQLKLSQEDQTTSFLSHALNEVGDDDCKMIAINNIKIWH